jgi:hypothetical protein
LNCYGVVNTEALNNKYPGVLALKEDFKYFLILSSINIVFCILVGYCSGSNKNKNREDNSIN